MNSASFKYKKKAGRVAHFRLKSLLSVGKLSPQILRKSRIEIRAYINDVVFNALAFQSRDTSHNTVRCDLKPNIFISDFHFLRMKGCVIMKGRKSKALYMF